MVDPGLGTVASVAAKLGSAALRRRDQPLGLPRVGGKEERRQVYTRFQDAALAVCLYLDREEGGRIRNSDENRAIILELFSAEYELRLVGNQGPIEVAMQLSTVLTRPGGRGGDGFAVLNRFTAVCRLDLWYQPSSWHVWRIAWWKLRWPVIKGWFRRKPELPEDQLKALPAEGDDQAQAEEEQGGEEQPAKDEASPPAQLL